MASLVTAQNFELRDAGIIRGPTNEKRLALEFTADSFGEGGATVLDQLAKHKAKAAFFLTGNFLRNPEFAPLIKRIVAEGHYVGPHSDSHPLLCDWTREKKTLVTKDFFNSDLKTNLEELERFGVPRAHVKFWIPPYENYNSEIVGWSKDLGLTLINYTPGTRSAADYTEDHADNFVSSEKILQSIVSAEQKDPRGLNGFLLLLHLGAGPKRTDKFPERLGDLLDYLSQKNYRFVRVDELLHSTTPNQ